MKKPLLLLLIAASTCVVLYAATNRHIPHAVSGSVVIDQNFNAPFLARPYTPLRSVLLPDGNYVMFFGIDTLTDQNTGALIRFNSDGSLDTSFSFSRDYPDVIAVAPLGNGQLIVAARHPVPYGVAVPSHHAIYDILRLNGDGSIDSTFGPAQSTDGGQPRAISIAPDGKILVAGFFTHFNGQPRQGLVRLLANGIVDPDFAPITLTAPVNPSLDPETFGIWAAPLMDAADKVVIGGDFVAVNGVSRPGVARLNSDGSLDTTFVPSGFAPYSVSSGFQRPIRGLGMQSNGKIIIGGRFIVGSANRVPLLRLNPDGSRDTTYSHLTSIPSSTGLVAVIKELLVQPDDKVIGVDFSVWRFNADGPLDSTFHNPELLVAQDCCANAYNIAREADGSYFIGGIFTDLDDTVGPYDDHWGAARLNADGTVRASFSTSHRTGLRIAPSSFFRTNDGATLIAFNSEGFIYWAYNTVSHNLGRLLSSGGLDGAFDPIASFNGPLYSDFTCLGFTALSDGSFLLTGDNHSDQDIVSYGRLLADGTQDTTYQAELYLYFDAAWPRDDGKVIVNQFWFTDRINPDGSLDNSFVLDGSVGDAEFDPNAGRFVAVYLGGGVLGLTANNTLLIGYPTRDGLAHLVRLNNDGSVDPTFPARTAPVVFDYTGQYFTYGPFGNMIGYQRNYFTVDFPFKQAKAVAGDKVLLVGSFANYGGTPAHGIVRLNNDGSIDPTFNLGGGAQWTQTQETDTFHPSVDNLEFLPNGKLLLTGSFEAFNGTPAPGIVCLNADGSVDTSFVAPVTRQKYDYQPTYLKAQPDGSFLLSGPYSRASQTSSPSFLRLLLPLTPTSVASKKIHGFAGTFTVDLPLTGTPGVECRSGGGTNDYTIVATFAGSVSVNGIPQAQVTSGTGTVGSGGVSNGGMVTVSGSTVTIPLTNVANAQTINVTLFGVSNGSASNNVVIPMNVLVGDVNGNGAVNATDVALAKSRIGQSIDATNFRADVNANGEINATDVSIVKSHIGNIAQISGTTPSQP